MNREIQNYQAKQTIEVISELDLVELEADLFLFNRAVSSTENTTRTRSKFKPSRTDAPSSHKVGAVNAKGKVELMAGKLPSKKNTKNLIWLSAEKIEQLRLWCFHNVMDMLRNDLDQDKTLTDVWAQFVANPERSLDELIELDYSSHMANDRHGNPIPVALMFDYINSHVDETRYDMPRLFEHLRARDDVFVICGNTSLNSDATKWKQAKTFEEALFCIPYYNADEGRQTSIQFIWQPKVEDYRKLFGGKYEGRHWAVLASDVLDIKQFRTSED